MTLQAVLVLILVALSVLYFLRGTLKSFVGGGCASGCGSCKQGGCAVKKIQAIQADLETPKPGPHSA